MLRACPACCAIAIASESDGRIIMTGPAEEVFGGAVALP
jgi:hypothetical protein